MVVLSAASLMLAGSLTLIPALRAPNDVALSARIASAASQRLAPIARTLGQGTYGGVVSDRLSAIDASFLYLDCDATPMHTGSVLRFAAPGIEYQDLIAAVSQHIGQSPRYRRRVREVPLHLGRPVWVDDERFDVEFHVRAATLPRPGERAQLDELVARLLSRRLDVDHPLWEMYVVDGLADGGVAVITKTHQAMVDGSGALPIEQALLSSAPGTLVQRSDAWEPQAEPGAISLVAQAVSDSITGPAGAVDAARSLVADVGSVAKAVGGRVLSVVHSVGI